MLPFLKAPADAPLMTDKYEIDARYRYWRRHILLTIWLGYALFYFTRKSFNAAVPEILANGVLSRSDIGLLATLFYITYGVSKFVSGIVSDRSNARYFMGIGLIATGIINILFGFSTSLWAFAVLWVLNAFFQGWGSPVCARLLTAWYSRTERGGWWALWNTAHNVGGALIPIVMAAAALHYGWRAGMMIAGCMAIVVGIFLCWRLRDRPQALGLPAVGEWRHDALEIAQQQEGAGLTRKEILTKYVLLNPYIWLLSFCYVLVYVVRAAINDWGNLYMSETLGVDLVTANTAVTMFELGGFIGALVAGWGSDKLFNGNRGPMNLIFAAGILLSVGSLWLMPFASYVMQATCFFTIGFFVFGPQMLIGMAAAECSHKEAAGAATGFVGLFAYLLSVLEAVGDITATAMVSRRPIQGEEYQSRLKGGVLADGLVSVIASAVGSLPLTTFAQNNGVIQMTGVASRYVGRTIAVMLVILGLFPMIGGFFTTIPSAVLGGAMTLMFSMIAIAGIRIIITNGLKRRETLIVATSLGLGLGVSYDPEIFKILPASIYVLVENPICAGGLTAILLNIILPGGYRQENVLPGITSAEEMD